MTRQFATAFALLLSTTFFTAAHASCTVHYTFTNGTTADATQVNQNFTDVTGCINASGTRNAYYTGTQVIVAATSAGNTMAGLGSSTTLTPTSTGHVKIIITGWTEGGSTSTIVGITPMYGTGTAPAHGAAMTGTAAAPEIRNTGNSVGSTGDSFSLYAEITGLTVGTPYWFDLSTANGLGGTFGVAVTTQLIEEF